MPRILHTSDWHLDADPVRLDAVARLAALATTHEVDLVVVAGNVLADLDLSDDTLDRIVVQLDAFEVPVLLVPGETDPAEPVGAWVRLLRRRGADAPWRLALEPGPVRLADIHLIAAPRPHTGCVDDLTRTLDPAGAVIVAHGGALGGPIADDAAHRIDVAHLREAGAVYVALGGRRAMELADGHAWPGSPEPLTAGQRGTALLVDLDPLRVQPLLTSPTTWTRRTLGPGDLDTVTPEPDAILELVFTGALGLDDRIALEDRLEALRPQLRRLTVDLSGLSTLPDPTTLDIAGPIRETIDALVRQGDLDAAKALHRLVGSP